MRSDTEMVAAAYSAQDRGDLRGLASLVQQSQGVLRGRLLMVLAYEIALQTGDASKVKRLLDAAIRLMTDNYVWLRQSQKMRIAIWTAVRDRPLAQQIIRERAAQGRHP